MPPSGEGTTQAEVGVGDAEEESSELCSVEGERCVLYESCIHTLLSVGITQVCVCACVCVVCVCMCMCVRTCTHVWFMPTWW